RGGSGPMRHRSSPRTGRMRCRAARRLRASRSSAPRTIRTRPDPAIPEVRLRLGVLSNLRAGRRGTDSPRMAELLRARPDVIAVETESAHELAPALAELLRREVEV